VIEITGVIVIGLLLGFIVGTLPGIGTTAILIGVYPWLVTFSVLELFIFYITLMATTQYFGSIPAIIFGVAGEVTSQPAVVYGHPVFKSGRGPELLAATAIGSFFASIIAILILYVASLNSAWIGSLMNNSARLFIFLSTIVVLIAASKQYFLGLVMCIFGIILGSVGWHPLFNIHFLVPKFTSLDAGIPTIAAFVGLLVLPNLVEFRKHKINHNPTQINLSIVQKLTLLITSFNKAVMLRASMIGSLIGLIPGLSFVLSSSTAAAVEKKIFKSNDFDTVIAAETANNAASITALIPLLILAIPIIPSEALVLGIAEMQGFGISTSLKFILTNLNLFVCVLVTVSFINLLLSGIGYNVAQNIYKYASSRIYDLLLVGVMLLTFINAYSEHQLMLTIIVMPVFFLIGSLIKSDNLKSTLIISFFLSEGITSELYRFYLFNF